MHQQTVPILSEDVFTILGDKQSIEILESTFAGMRSTSNGIRNKSKKKYYVRLTGSLKWVLWRKGNLSTI